MRIAILGAMESECIGLQALVSIPRDYQLAAWKGWTGSYKEHELFIFHSQVGKVLAAALTQAVISELRPDVVLFTGVAGALSPALNIGDVVISETAMQHDLDAAALGYERGTIPYTGTSDVEADKELVAILQRCRLDDGAKIHSGRILTGDQFIANNRTEYPHLALLDGLAVEMEGAAAALVCHINNVRWVLIRTISDRADGLAAAHFEEFLPTATRHSVSLVQQLLDRI